MTPKNSKRFIGIFLIMMPAIAWTQISALNGQIIRDKLMDKFLTSKMELLGIPGLSIAFMCNGQVVYSKSFGYSNVMAKTKVTRNTIFEAASLSKSVFALYVMQLAEKNILSLDTPLYKYLPYPDIAYDERYKLITARMVLSHTSGFPNWRSEPRDTVINVAADALYLKFTPGTQFFYSGEGYVYLGRVIEHLLNTDKFSISKNINQDICLPYRMKHSSFNWNNYIQQHKATGYINNGNGVNVATPAKKFVEFDPAGGFYTNASEFARWMLRMMKLKFSANPHYAQMFIAQSHPSPTDERDAWALGLAMKKTAYGIQYKHSGNNRDFQAYYSMYPDKQSGFVFFINNNMASSLYHDVQRFFETGVFPKEKASIPMEPEKIKKYVGNYQMNKKTIMTITRKGNKLFFQQSGSPAVFELFCSAENQFFFKTDPALIEFIVDEKRQVTTMILSAGSINHLLKKVN